MGPSLRREIAGIALIVLATFVGGALLFQSVPAEGSCLAARGVFGPVGGCLKWSLFSLLGAPAAALVPLIPLVHGLRLLGRMQGETDRRWLTFLAGFVVLLPLIVGLATGTGRLADSPAGLLGGLPELLPRARLRAGGRMAGRRTARQRAHGVDAALESGPRTRERVSAHSLGELPSRPTPRSWSRAPRRCRPSMGPRETPDRRRRRRDRGGRPRDANRPSRRTRRPPAEPSRRRARGQGARCRTAGAASSRSHADDLRRGRARGQASRAGAPDSRASAATSM